MIFKKILNFKQDVETTFLDDDSKLLEKSTSLIDRRRHQLTALLESLDPKPVCEPILGVTTIADMGSILRQVFRDRDVKFATVYAGLVSRLIEVKIPESRCVAVRELTRAFESALESGLEVTNKIEYKAVPLLACGIHSQKIEHTDSENLIKFGGEILDIENSSQMKSSMSQIFSRASVTMKLPQNIDYLVAYRNILRVLQMIYNSFSDRKAKAQQVHENLIKFDRVVFEKILQPLMETIFKVSRSHLRGELQRSLGVLDWDGISNSSNSYNNMEGSWYFRLDKSAAIILNNF